MAHCGLLRDYRFSADVDDIRGSTLCRARDEKIGKIDDFIFDYATGTIQYVVVDAGEWMGTRKFLVLVGCLCSRGEDENEFATDLAKEQVKPLPEYDETHVSDEKS